METTAAKIKIGPFEFPNTVHRNDSELWNNKQKAGYYFSSNRTAFDQI